MSTPADRASFRRAHWFGAVVELGSAKGRLHAQSTAAERLQALIELSARAWRAGGRPSPTLTPRAQWPGEVFESPRRG